VRTRESEPREVGLSDEQAQQLRLAYAQHVYKAQGATVDRAFVLMGGWQTDRERAHVALTRARESTDVFVSRDDLGQDGLDDGAIKRLGDRIQCSQAQRASITREARPKRERPGDLATERSPAMPDSRADRRPAVDERQPGSGGAAELPAKPERDPEVARQQERESEAGRILRQSRERERAEALARGDDRHAHNPDELDDARSDHAHHGSVRLANESYEAHIAEPRAARWSEAQAAEPESEAGRVLREQREREALDRGWGIE
jgi:hypothetical protein